MNLLFFLIGTSKVNTPFLLSQAQCFLNCQCGGVDFDLYPFSFLNCNCYILIDTTLLIIQAGLLQLMVEKIPDQFLMNTVSWRFLFLDCIASIQMMICYWISLKFRLPLRINVGRINATVDLDVTVNVLDFGEIVPVSYLSVVRFYPSLL